MAFNASRHASVGVEWELELVDRVTRDLAQASVEVLEEIRPADLDSHPKAKHELYQSTVEIITGVCDSVPQARSDIAVTLAEVRGAAERRGLGLVGSGTHPFNHWAEQQISPNPRYHSLVERLQWPAHRLATHGVHVHVGVTSREKVIPFVTALTAYVPHLLGLTASSPYWMGRDTGLASARTKIFESLPTAGLPEQFSDWTEFESYVAAQITAGSIDTIREVWWDIRPHPNFGTVEVRVFDDVPTLDELMMAAALTQSLVQQFDDHMEQGYALPRPREWVVRENKWRAARFGLEADIVLDESGRVGPLRGEIERLLEDLAPTARRLGCESDLEFARTVLEVGPSYVRQRRTAAEHAGDLRAVVDSLLREMDEGVTR